MIFLDGAGAMRGAAVYVCSFVTRAQFSTNTPPAYHTTMATSEDDDDAPMEAPPGKESNEEDSDVELEGKKKAVEHIIERSRRNVYPDEFLSYHASIVNK